MADAEAFLREASHFRLGSLPTEGQHPKTKALAQLARDDVGGAVALLQEVDVDALTHVEAAAPRIDALRQQVTATLDAGGRVFLCGCGATGRLSLALEVLWRERNAGAPHEDRVVAFMAGGDLALVHSIENFEDIPAYGARQLRELGFGDDDLLIACTEGGETPFVIGATEEAARVSRRRPWFLYCNPDESLMSVARSRAVIESEQIEKISLFVGCMALSGSTRMQASTVLQLAVGLALLACDHTAAVADEVVAFTQLVSRVDLGFVAALVCLESDIYAAGGGVRYETRTHGITVVTDTTERAPTFSMRAFENDADPTREPALSYVHIPGTGSALEAWRSLLRREPRTLEWEGVAVVAGRARLLGFDFSDALPEKRAARWHAWALREGRSRGPDGVFAIGRTVEGGVSLSLTSPEGVVGGALSMAPLPLLFEHLLLKIALNIHSTLVMGRLGRYTRNVMTWVRPSNKKLIDRTIRYVTLLLADEGKTASYDEVAHAVFAEIDDTPPSEPIVLRVFERLRRA